MPTRIERLQQGRKKLKEARAHYTLLDIGGDREFLGIDVSRWIYVKLRDRLQRGRLDSSIMSICNEYNIQPQTTDGFLRAKAVATHFLEQGDGQTFTTKLAEYTGADPSRLKINSIYLPPDEDVILVEGQAPEQRYSDADVEALLRDLKLLFRAEHVALLLNALRPWESFLGMYSECFELASNNMSSVISDVQAGSDRSKEIFKTIASTVLIAGFSALALTGVGLIPAIAAAAAAESATFGGKLGVEMANKGVEAGIQLFVDRGKESSWLDRKLNRWFNRPPDSNKTDVDVRKFRASMISVISDIREFAFSIVDVTSDRDIYMILDYVHDQAKSGKKVGLKTSGADAGKQQDDADAKGKRDLGGIALVRKARNTLEKAFEFWFARMMTKMQFPEELTRIRADKDEAFSFMSQRVELEFWKEWVRLSIKPTNQTTKAVPPMLEKTPDQIRAYISSVGINTHQLISGPLSYISTACPEYATWLSGVEGLPKSKTVWERMTSAQGTRQYPKEQEFRTWLDSAKNSKWDPLTLAPRR